jgi:hypothetical protein
MKHILFACFLLGIAHATSGAEPSGKPASHVGTKADFLQLLLDTKWSWRNVSAGVPDRECVFMKDGTFRHPHFVAKFKIIDINKVELIRKGGKAELTFDPSYLSFEAIDFDKHRITGQRLQK